jgi:hypothetical protein
MAAARLAPGRTSTVGPATPPGGESVIESFSGAGTGLKVSHATRRGRSIRLAADITIRAILKRAFLGRPRPD